MDGDTHAGLTRRATRRLFACALLGLAVAAWATVGAPGGGSPPRPAGLPPVPWDTPLPGTWAEIAEAEIAERALSEVYTQSRSPLRDNPARPEAIGADHLPLMPVTK